MRRGLHVVVVTTLDAMGQGHVSGPIAGDPREFVSVYPIQETDIIL